MRYSKIKKATFLERPNRFIALCRVDDHIEVCHVKNTGRCRELLLPGVTVFLAESDNPKRKTKYDLIAVYKGDVLFNLDSQAPNRVFYEFLSVGGLFPDVTLIKPESKFGNSRFDFYVEHGDKEAFIEVKGVTLEENGALLFPDAPTERGVKHIEELCAAMDDGYEAYVVFVVQTEKASYFAPNAKTHPAFADALRHAKEKGVRILCYSCRTEPDLLEIRDLVPVKL